MSTNTFASFTNEGEVRFTSNAVITPENVNSTSIKLREPKPSTGSANPAGWSRNDMPRFCDAAARSTLCVGLPSKVMSGIVAKINADPLVNVTGKGQLYGNYSWFFAQTLPATAFTLTLKQGNITKMDSFQAFLKKVKSSVLCDVGLKIDVVFLGPPRLFGLLQDTRLEVTIVNLHVRDLTELSPPRTVVAVETVATDGAVNEALVKKLADRGIHLTGGTLRHSTNTGGGSKRDAPTDGKRDGRSSAKAVKQEAPGNAFGSTSR
ncbi:uncharacterized protein PFL1_05303 [Pseudozyma flocculosa PF-1]|uniref:Uncharacterized protein n=2 Tax=Pseudozyma flocculosa TaxID=84751 RepID=A0A5C3FE89_9BASI|nr:uncharacterized protein PFL1_05303 [Pseudozyma flocculosa PF-1]EPQ27019.1 hypothetical protein PFL1_05303 [Pseudozyma flocculosa PF-1]SPO42015.1 uncharacterized protein PSFLO_07498 [Pseudozyma flocculosa]